MIFGNKGKLSSRYVVLYRILKRVDKVAYERTSNITRRGSSGLYHFLVEEVCG